MDDLYRENILEHYKQPRNWGELEDPDLEFEDNNPLCGDELKVQLKVEGDRVADVRFSGHGCAISQASASMASEELVGMPVDDLVRLDKDFVLDLLGHRHLRDADEVRAAHAQGRQVGGAGPRGGVGAGDAAERVRVRARRAEALSARRTPGAARRAARRAAAAGRRARARACRSRAARRPRAAARPRARAAATTTPAAASAVSSAALRAPS